MSLDAFLATAALARASEHQAHQDRLATLRAAKAARTSAARSRRRPADPTQGALCP